MSATLPPYTHIPGITPHPLGDPQGHSFGQIHVRCEPPDWPGLADCELFQTGRQLFNAGYYWEAHEAWEGVWIAVGRSGLVADFLKGLIKLAAAGVKLREGSTTGAQRHLARVRELFLLTQARLNAEPQRLARRSEATSSGTLREVQEDANNLEWLLQVVTGLQANLPAIPAPDSGRPISLIDPI